MAWMIAIGVDDEAAPDVDPGGLVVNAVGRSDGSTLVGEHGKGHAALDHLGEFLLLPDEVGKTAVRGDREHFYAELLEFRMRGGDRRQFGGSDEGEITRIEAE